MLGKCCLPACLPACLSTPGRLTLQILNASCRRWNRVNGKGAGYQNLMHDISSFRRMFLSEGLWHASPEEQMLPYGPSYRSITSFNSGVWKTKAHSLFPGLVPEGRKKPCQYRRNLMKHMLPGMHTDPRLTTRKSYQHSSTDIRVQTAL